jgi:hypothetical protein
VRLQLVAAADDLARAANQTIVSVTSAGISATALVVSLLAYVLKRRNAVAGRRSVLVFEWTDATGWQVNNPGNGPALNVRVTVRGKRTGWSSMVTVPAFPSGSTFALPCGRGGTQRLWPNTCRAG